MIPLAFPYPSHQFYFRSNLISFFAVSDYNLTEGIAANNGGNKRELIVLILVLILAGSIIGFYMYNKEGPDVNNASAVKVTATELYELFTKDSVSAKKKYAEQILEVVGEVSGVSKNQQDHLIILLKTNTSGAAVNCTMEGPAGSLQNGNRISLKGICKGLGQGDADLGIAPDVYITRCYIGL